MDRNKLKELSERTHLPLEVCFKLLKECQEDIEKALLKLPEVYAKIAEKKKGRESKHGVVGFKKLSTGVLYVQLLSETDFVSDSKMFSSFVNEILDSISNHFNTPKDPINNENIYNYAHNSSDVLNITMKSTAIFGENTVIGKIGIIEGQNIHIKQHRSLGENISKFIVIISLSKEDKVLADEVCQHIISLESPNITSLLQEKFVYDNEKTIGELLKKKNNSIKEYVYAKGDF
jgi:elongation factor Ts